MNSRRVDRSAAVATVVLCDVGGSQFKRVRSWSAVAGQCWSFLTMNRWQPVVIGLQQMRDEKITIPTLVSAV